MDPFDDFDDEFDQYWGDVDFEYDRDSEEEDANADAQPMEAQPLRKRYIRNVFKPFETYRNDVEFKRRFRFSKRVCEQTLLPLVQEALEKPTRRGLPISPMDQLLIALRFYATGCFQIVSADLANISQATVSRIVRRVSRAIALKFPEKVHFPSEEVAPINRRQYQQLSMQDGFSIPGIDGAIDCTHIELFSTYGQDYPDRFRNRHGVYSLNVQCIVGPSMEFMDVVAGWPGGQHDSRIFQNSVANMRYRTGQLSGILLGDNGYPSLPYLFTPVSNPTTAAERRYNKCHIKARNIVERVFGVWKKRFPCLSKKLGLKLESCTSVIIACAVLYNIAVELDEELPEDDAEEVEMRPDPPVPNFDPALVPLMQHGEGLRLRRALIDELFI